MDLDKLKRLRDTYEDADGIDYFTDKFRRVGEKMADRQHAATKPYSGIPTFLDLPHREDLEGLDVALICDEDSVYYLSTTPHFISAKSGRATILAVLYEG